MRFDSVIHGRHFAVALHSPLVSFLLFSAPMANSEDEMAGLGSDESNDDGQQSVLGSRKARSAVSVKTGLSSKARMCRPCHACDLDEDASGESVALHCVGCKLTSKDVLPLTLGLNENA